MNAHIHSPTRSAHCYGSLWFRTIARQGWVEYLVGASPDHHASPSRWAADLGNFLLETGAALVELDAFGDPTLLTRLRHALAKWLPAGFPVSMLQNGGNRGPHAGGMLVRAVAGVPVTPVLHGRTTAGFRFEDGEAAYCYLGGLVPIQETGTNGAVQTREVMAAIRDCLATAGMGFREVARTWYYLDDILSWYGEFNATRNGFFAEHEVFSRLMPASTGIGIANDTGLLPLAKVHACRGKTPALCVAVAESPLQNSAYDYGSAFSRAVTITSPAGTTLHVSGTASIDADGHTLHAGKVHDQIQHTMDVVHGILRAAGMGWEHAVRGIAYFNDATNLPLWEPVRAAWGLPPQTCLNVHADICRPDLLFELELEAFKP